MGQPMLAVSAYNAPSFGREIQLVGLDGERIRVDPHPPTPIDGGWSPDGRRIAFSGGDGPPYALGFRGIYTSDSRGRDVRLLYAAATDRLRDSPFSFMPSWSPDGKSIAFSVDHDGPWIVGADGQRARRVVDLYVDERVAWSPDGRRIAFGGAKSDSNAGVYTVGVDGTRLRRLARNSTPMFTDILDVAWAPDASRIVFTRSNGEVSEINVVGADGRNERRVALGVCPVWSPDGRRLAFAAQDRSERFVGIDVIRVDGGPATVITKRADASCPVWTADGRRIVFMVGHGSPRVADATGRSVRSPSPGERRRIRLAPTASQWSSTDGKFLAGDGDFDENWYVVRVFTLRGTLATFRWSDDFAPAWSPDGQKLAFVRLQKTDAIFVLDTAGNHVRRLAAGTNPTWSPDGKWIAFERKNQIFVVASGGGTARAIGKGNLPAWSPDSRSVAAVGAGLFVMPRAGGAPRRVDQPEQETCLGGRGSETMHGRPAWSHDGRELAFTYFIDACQEDELAVVTSDGTSQRVVAQGVSPQWSPDDAQIAFIDDYERLLYIPSAGGSARVLAGGHPVDSFSLAADGRLFAYAVDNPRVNGTDVWLVQTDGSGRRPLLEGGSDNDPVWRP